VCICAQPSWPMHHHGRVALTRAAVRVCVQQHKRVCACRCTVVFGEGRAHAWWATYSRSWRFSWVALVEPPCSRHSRASLAVTPARHGMSSPSSSLASIAVQPRLTVKYVAVTVPQKNVHRDSSTATASSDTAAHNTPSAWRASSPQPRAW
jgi:hypothetical protein